jgi:transcriptional regulator with XRE-family HTH domain
VGTSIGEEVGRALRRARLARGLTLRQVGERSAGAFKPTAVAGYERAERSISLERYCELCGFYGMEPAWLLAEILETVGGRPERIVDLTRLEDATPASPTDG